jgi:uncharacterized RDD family membrane protein YckC
MSLTIEMQRAGFWRRACAFLIDAVAVSLLLTVIGLALFAPSGERIRVTPVFGNTHCTAVDPQELGFTPPDGFKVTSVARCTRTFLGRVVDRVVRAQEVTKGPETDDYEVTYRRSLTYTVDAQGRPVDVVHLDAYWVHVLAVYLLLAEWLFGATLGKALLGVRVKPLAGVALKFDQVARRVLVRMIPFAPVAMPSVGAKMSALLLENVPLFLAVVGVWVLVSVVFLVNFVRAVRAGNLPWHDRAARTEAVRSPRAVPTSQPSAAT